MPSEKASSEYDRNLLVFCVRDKWFCFVNIDVFDFCDLKCRPEQIEELQARYEGIRPGYHMNKKHWISVSLNQDVPDETVKALVRQSYELVADSLPQRQKQELAKR